MTPVQVVHSEGPHLVLLVVVYMREEIVGRGLSSVLSVVDSGILGGIVLILHSLAPVLVEEVGLLVWVEAQVEV